MERLALHFTSGKHRERIRALVGVAISLAGLCFVGLALIRHQRDIANVLAGADPTYLVGAFAMGAVGMTTIALAWHWALRVCGIRLPRALTVALYYRGEIGKYVPGGVWPAVGRAELVRRLKFDAGPAYSSVLLGLGTLYAAAGGVSFLLMSQGGVPGLGWLVLGIGTLLVSFHPIIWRLLTTALVRISRNRLVFPSRAHVAWLVLASVPAWLLIGTATWLLGRGLAPDLPYVRVIGATAFSWLVGFLALPAPGGIGVREAVFVVSMGSVPTGVAAAIALVGRLVFMAIDSVGALIGTFLERRLVVRYRATTREGH